MNYIFSAVGFIILIPIVFILPLGLKKITKIMILFCAFLLGVIGIFVEPYLPSWQLYLSLIAMAFVISYIIDKRMALNQKEEVKLHNFTKEKRKIIIQDQMIDNHGRNRLFDKFENEPNNTDNLREDLPIQNTSVAEVSGRIEGKPDIDKLAVEQEVAASIEVEEIPVDSDWLNDLEHFNEDKEPLTATKTNVELDDDLQELDLLLAERIDKHVEKQKEIPAQPNFLSELEELQELDIVLDEKELKQEKEKPLHMDTIEELTFDSKDNKYREK